MTQSTWMSRCGMKRTVLTCLAVLFNLTGCATEQDAVESVEQADTRYDRAYIDQMTIGVGLLITDARSSSFVINDGNAVFTPSSSLSQALYRDPNQLNHQVSFSIPDYSYDLGFFLPTVTVRVARATLDMSSVNINMGQNSLETDFALSGSLHIHAATPWPDADLILDRVAVHVSTSTLGSRRLNVDNVTVDISHHVENCGIFGWCDGFVNSHVPDDVGNRVADIFKDKINAQLALPVNVTGIFQILGDIWNVSHQAGGPPWIVDSYPLDFSSWRLNFNVRRVIPPALPTGCRGTFLCGSRVWVTCDQIPEILLLQRQAADLSWETIATDGYYIPDHVNLVDGRPPPPSANYRVCATNAAGTVCANPFTVIIPPGDHSCAADPNPPEEWCHPMFPCDCGRCPLVD